MYGRRWGLLITGGSAPEKRWFEFIKNSVDIVVAADSGVETAADIGVKIDYVVGDMDSLSDETILEKFPEKSVLRFEKDKDDTDTEIGLSVLREKGCTFRCIWGGGGGRLDHLIGILSLFDREDAPDMWLTESAVIVLIKDIFELEGMDGRTVSFFPLGTGTSTMVSSGLKWPLDTLKWRKGDTGVSNVTVSSHVEVKMCTGKLAFVGELETLRGLSW